MQITLPETSLGKPVSLQTLLIQTTLRPQTVSAHNPTGALWAREAIPCRVFQTTKIITHGRSVCSFPWSPKGFGTVSGEEKYSNAARIKERMLAHWIARAKRFQKAICISSLTREACTKHGLLLSRTSLDLYLRRPLNSAPWLGNLIGHDKCCFGQSRVYRHHFSKLTWLLSSGYYHARSASGWPAKGKFCDFEIFERGGEEKPTPRQCSHCEGCVVLWNAGTEGEGGKAWLPQEIETFSRNNARNLSLGEAFGPSNFSRSSRSGRGQFSGYSQRTRLLWGRYQGKISASYAHHDYAAGLFFSSASLESKTNSLTQLRTMGRRCQWLILHVLLEMDRSFTDSGASTNMAHDRSTLQDCGPFE